MEGKPEAVCRSTNTKEEQQEATFWSSACDDEYVHINMGASEIYYG